MTSEGAKDRDGGMIAVVPTLQRDIGHLRRLCDGLREHGFSPRLVVTGKKLDDALSPTDLPRVSPRDNPGFGAAVREGIAATANWSWLLILNDDTDLDAGTLQVCREITQEHPCDEKVLAYLDPGPRRPIPGRMSVFRSVSLADSVLQRAGRCTTGSQIGPWYKSFSCSLISRGLWDELDGFDRRLIYTYEDADFGGRALAVGATVLAPTSGIVHEGNSTSKKHIDTVLPVSAYSAREYLVSRGDTRVAASAVVTAALVIRCVCTPFAAVPFTAHLRGIGRGLRAIITGPAPRLPRYEDS